MTTTPSPACRFCGSSLDTLFVDLGHMALSNAFLRPEDIGGGRDRVFPLIVRVCADCFLVQTDEVVGHNEIFDADYVYYSSYTDSWVRHAELYAETMRARFNLDAKSQIVEIGSNDGYLLQHFMKAGIPVQGVEPATNVALAAIAKGVPTHIDYFGRRSGRDLARNGVAADLTIANNVLAHVPDILDFVMGFSELLKPDGIATFEFPHILNLIKHVQFDTIYHEHYSYLSLLVVEKVFSEAGLRVFDVEELPTHGGSLRVFACHEGARHAEAAAVGAIRAAEKSASLHRLDGYLGLSSRIEACCASFRSFLAEARGREETVAAYGAAAKGNTFLNACGVTCSDIPFVADRNHAKQGKVLPGSHIPVVSPEALTSARPDYVVILAWNIAEEVRAQLDTLAQGGTRFVTAIPETRIL